ncbi:MAG: Flagellar hook-length control protein FliK [Phycisphaerales bacterium]|nr:Flagellar hook-length control protein FliK [Phycisphaerales bacterium]
MRRFDLESLERRALLSVQLVSDLNTTPGSSDPHDVVQANGLTFFVADDGAHGLEVWRTDGTTIGTLLVRDIAPGSDSSIPVLIGAVGNMAIFRTTTGDFWSTDGVSNTNRLLTTVHPGASANLSATIGNVLYFGGVDKLYRVQSGFMSQVAQLTSNVTKMMAVGSKVFILTADNKLWASDGTASGTVALKTLRSSLSGPFDMAEVEGTLYFTARNAQTSASELWKSLGTAATTTLVAPLTGNLPLSLTAVDRGLFYITESNSFNQLVWRFDTQTNQATQLATISDFYSSFTTLRTARAGSKFYFVDRTTNSNLWVSDGTPAGTMLLKANAANIASITARTLMMDFNGTLLFQAADAAGGSEVWRTDGTVANTVRVADVVPGTTGSTPQFLGVSGGRMIMNAFEPERGREPWYTDGTPEGTGLLKDLYVGTDGSNPRALVGINGRLVFVANGSGVSTVYVMADPAGGAAEPLTVGVGGPTATSTATLIRAGGLVYFDASVGGLGYLCVTDGTPEGTRTVKQFSGNLTNFFAQGNRVYFTINSTYYTSDGTDAGTIPLLTLSSGFYFVGDAENAQREVAAFNGLTYFIAQNGLNTAQLWKTDGTSQGTSLVSTIATSSGSAHYLTPTGGRLYLLSGAGVLLETDGSTAVVQTPGTTGGQYFKLDAIGDVLLIKPYSGSLLRYRAGDAAPTTLAPVIAAAFSPVARMGKWLYFVGSLNGGFGQVWRTDGTPGGTTMVADAVSAEDLTPAGGLIYYIDSAGNHGREVWATSGTPGGTYLVGDLIPGVGSPAPNYLTEAGGIAYFSADDGVHGAELFRAVDDVAPRAVTSTFDFAGRPPRVAVAFSENVGGFSLGDWKLTDRATGKDASSLLTSFEFDADMNVARLMCAASLPDGDYRLTLAAGAAQDAAGNRTTDAITLDFFQFAGDFNRDRSVDFNDLAVLAQNYNGTGKTWATGDINGDGMTDFLDLALMAQRYNTSLSVLAAAASAPASVANVTPARAVATTRESKPSVFNVVQPINRRPLPSRKPVQRKGH